ncbi:hypothetical protein P5673_030391 [Acropora cervicornis]|uniref:Uncharacterized protein n=1 Tax=Acropora cervicornis TaxID=6130 RepID=A0AAD9PU69_ACRCE|nr:hypothetical protein P5673_030391 [Acropora cervicornis]
MRCSVFEEDEETPGWEASRRVARCEPCLWEMMENEVNEVEFYQESETSISVSSRSSSSCGGKSLQSTAKNRRYRVEDGKLKDGSVDEKSNDDDDEEEEEEEEEV